MSSPRKSAIYAAASRYTTLAAATPASYFAIVLGIAGLANAWRAASEVWHLTPLVGEWLYALAAAIWLVLIVLYASKALLASEQLAADAAHPVQCCFIGLVGVSTMLMAAGLIRYSSVGATYLFVAGLLFTISFGVWRTGGLWKGGRDPSTLTAVLYLPTVAGSFVAATVVSGLGHPDWGQLAFGAGMFSWVAMESVLLHRLLTGPTTDVSLRPTLGIQLAPAPVGAVAYFAVGSGTPDLFVHALIGYGVLQLLILLRLSLWIAESGLTPGLWAFSFGLTTIATTPIRLVGHGDSGAMSILAPMLLAIANIAIFLLILMTVYLLGRGQMFRSPPSLVKAASSN